MIKGRKGRQRKYPYYKTLIVTQLPDNIDIDILCKLLGELRTNNKGCWIRGEDSTVYTYIKYEGKAVRAHRLSYKLFKGKDLLLNGCHTCDVPACINPDHILDRSTNWNNRDARSKGRFVDLKFRSKEEKLLISNHYKNNQFRHYLKEGNLEPIK